VIGFIPEMMTRSPGMLRITNGVVAVPDRPGL